MGAKEDCRNGARDKTLTLFFLLWSAQERVQYIQQYRTHVVVAAKKFCVNYYAPAIESQKLRIY